MLCVTPRQVLFLNSSDRIFALGRNDAFDYEEDLVIQTLFVQVCVEVDMVFVLVFETVAFTRPFNLPRLGPARSSEEKLQIFLRVIVHEGEKKLTAELIPVSRPFEQRWGVEPFQTLRLDKVRFRVPELILIRDPQVVKTHSVLF